MKYRHWFAAAAGITLLSVTPFAFGAATAVARPNVRRLCQTPALKLDEARDYTAWALDSVHFDGDVPDVKSPPASAPLPDAVAAATYTDADANSTIVLGPQSSLPSLAHEIAHVRWRNFDTPRQARAHTNATLRASGQIDHVYAALGSLRSDMLMATHYRDTLAVLPLDTIQARWRSFATSHPAHSTEVLRDRLVDVVLRDTTLFRVISSYRRLHIAAMETLSGDDLPQRKSSSTYWSTRDEIGYELAEEAAGYATADTVTANCAAYISH